MCLSLFLWIGKMFDYFQISGNILWFIQLLNVIKSDSTIAVSHVFNILMDILSWPWTFFTFNDLIMLIISLFSNLIKESLVFVVKVLFSGIVLLCKGVHWDAKKLLKSFACASRSEIMLLSIRNRGMIGTFSPLLKVF